MDQNNTPLYNAILGYIRKNTEVALDRAREKDPSLSLMQSDLLQSIMTKSKVILDISYELKDSEVTEQTLDSIDTLLEKPQDTTLKSDPISMEVDLIGRQVDKANIEFYQKFACCDNQSANYEEAAREIFKNEAEYRKALEPLVEAEKRQTEPVINKFYVQQVGEVDANELFKQYKLICEMEREVRGESIKRIFAQK